MVCSKQRSASLIFCCRAPIHNFNKPVSLSSSFSTAASYKQIKASLFPEIFIKYCHYYWTTGVKTAESVLTEEEKDHFINWRVSLLYLHYPLFSSFEPSMNSHNGRRLSEYRCVHEAQRRTRWVAITVVKSAELPLTPRGPERRWLTSRVGQLAMWMASLKTINGNYSASQSDRPAWGEASTQFSPKPITKMKWK